MQVYANKHKALPEIEQQTSCIKVRKKLPSCSFRRWHQDPSSRKRKKRREDSPAMDDRRAGVLRLTIDALSNVAHKLDQFVDVLWHFVVRPNSVVKLSDRSRFRALKHKGRVLVNPDRPERILLVLNKCMAERPAVKNDADAARFNTERKPNSGRCFACTRKQN